MLEENATAVTRVWERTATVHKSTLIKILISYYNSRLWTFLLLTLEKQYN